MNESTGRVVALQTYPFFIVKFTTLDSTVGRAFYILVGTLDTPRYVTPAGIVNDHHFANIQISETIPDQFVRIRNTPTTGTTSDVHTSRIRCTLLMHWLLVMSSTYPP